MWRITVWMTCNIVINVIRYTYFLHRFIKCFSSSILIVKLWHQWRGNMDTIWIPKSRLEIVDLEWRCACTLNRSTTATLIHFKQPTFFGGFANFFVAPQSKVSSQTSWMYCCLTRGSCLTSCIWALGCSDRHCGHLVASKLGDISM